MIFDRLSSSARSARPVHFLLATAVLGAAVSGACHRTPDPDEYFPGSGGTVSTGNAPGFGGDSNTGGLPSSLGGAGGTGPLVDCGPPPEVKGSFSKRRLLESSALCAEWHYCQFENAATLLEQKVGAWAESPSSETQGAAQLAWRQAMESWSAAELFQYGPAGSSAMDPHHGKGLRNLIYAWPGNARCRVEEQIASGRYATQGFDQVLTSARGLFALEYSLFYPGSDHACLGTSATAETWATLSPNEIAERKRAYADAVADDVLSTVRALRAAWDPSEGNFRKTFVDAVGYEEPAIGNDQRALNVVAWSLLYVEREIKDWKVGHPAGVNLNAPVDGFETPYGLMAVQNLRANLRASLTLFLGCGADGIGFDDWLRAANVGELADDLKAAWQNAISVADAFPPFHEASEAQFQALYAAIKGITDLLKGEMIGAGSPLNLSLPGGLEGDND